MSIRPLHDRIIVKRLESITTSPGGIVLPDSAKEKPTVALVVAVGNGKPLNNGQVRPLSVKVNDQVLIGKYTGTEIKLNGIEHLVVREDEIFAVLDQAQ